MGSAGMVTGPPFVGVKMASEIECAWAAGFFDGEGCVLIYPQRGRTGLRHSLRIVVIQVDVRPLFEMKRLFGGRVSIKQKATAASAQSHQWDAGPVPSMHALIAMLPYLRVKKEVAELGINFQRGKKGRACYGRGRFMASSDRESEIWHANAVKMLNRRGVQKGNTDPLVKPYSPQLRLVG